MANYDTSHSTAATHRRVQDNSVDETRDLISAGKVKGTKIYNSDGDDLGSVYDLMIDKRGGRVAYALVSFGGFLGIGEKYHPLPWHVLTYDEDKGGYNIGLTEDQLRNAPAYSQDEIAEFGADRDDTLIAAYYGGLGYPPLI
jgi:sporulation protein YlmC with PRC-barrel domain